MKKRIFTSFTIIIFLSCFFFINISSAESLEEQKKEVENQKQEAENKLGYVKEELSSTLMRVQELDDNITKAQNEIEKMTEQLKNIQEEVTVLQNSLNEKQKIYNENKALFEKRLVAMYEKGETTYLEVLLRSTSIIEFISNYYYMKEIMQSDKDLLNAINEEKEKIELAKDKLDTQKASLKILKAKQEQTYITMQNNKTVQANIIAQLSEEEKSLQEKIDEYKREQQRIEYLINFAEGLGYDGEFTGGIFAWPVAKSGTAITSDYGVREHPVQGIVKEHSGIDIGNAGYGAPVIAAADGIVSYAGELGGYGNCIMINHGSGVTTLYGHGQKVLTEVGKEVKMGDLIMEVGSTGISTGPHLHFEVRINGYTVDPKLYLK